MRPIRSPRDAEEAAADTFRSWGYSHVALSGLGADGGIDVVADGVIAQVKAEMKPTGRPAIQRLAGVANVEGADAFFFSLSGYTPEAVQWADLAGVALFRFDYEGDAEPVNEAARLVSSGKRRAPEPQSWDHVADSIRRTQGMSRVFSGSDTYQIRVHEPEVAVVIHMTEIAGELHVRVVLKDSIVDSALGHGGWEPGSFETRETLKGRIFDRRPTVQQRFDTRRDAAASIAELCKVLGADPTTWTPDPL